MFFDSLKIRNFGPFSEFQTQFSALGVNVISGPNGSGKTQLVGAALFALFGAESVDYRPFGRGPSEVKLVIGEGENSQIIECTVAGETPRDGEELPLMRTVTNQPAGSGVGTLIDRLSASIADADTPDLILAPVGDVASINAQSLELIAQAMSDHGLGELRRLMEEAYSGVIQPNMLSEAGREVYRLIQEFVKRRDTDFSIPLVVDGGFAFLDQRILELAWELLCAIGQRDQVIVLTSRSEELIPVARECIKAHIKLEPIASPHMSVVSYRSSFLGLQAQRYELGQKKPRFILGRPVDVEEDRHCEFKEVKGKNPVSSIKSLADQYVVAFLNLEERNLGSIYWGVRDGDRVVVGVELNQRDRDEVRKVVTEKLHQIQPPIAPTAYRVIMHHVCDRSGKEVPNLYVVEIAIPAVSSDYLYSTGKGEVYLKTDSGKKKLTMLEIQKEVLRRHQTGQSV